MSETVIVYRKELLRLSETFIKAQVQSYQRWQAVLFGERLWPGGLSLQDVRSRTLMDGEPTMTERVWAKARQTAGFAPRGLMDRFRSVNAKIFHAHFAHDAILALPYARKLNLPLVVTLHGHDVNVQPNCYRCGEYGFWHRDYPRRFAALVQERDVNFIAVSQALKEAAIDYGVPETRLRVYYTGIDVRQFQPSPKPIGDRPRRIVFVGRLVEMKGCALLIKAFAEIKRRLPDVELVILGDGPLRASLEAKATETNVGIKFLGEVTHEVVQSQLHDAWILCLPSITGSCGSFESFGMVLLEAQACGVPVVTSSRGGLEGVIHGVTGFTFPEGDVYALTMRIFQILQNRDLAERMSHEGPSYVRQNFDILNCTRKIESFYDEILSVRSRNLKPGLRPVAKRQVYR